MIGDGLLSFIITQKQNTKFEMEELVFSRLNKVQMSNTKIHADLL